MQTTPRRDPKKFAQRTMAAAIAASALATLGLTASAQTTGGGIGANVNSNPGASGNLPTQGTTGTAGGTATAGVAAPNAPANPLRPGTGPGINNTGSPVLSTPRNLQTPIGGAGGRTPRGTSRIPGNAIPTNPRLNPGATNGVNGAVIPQPITPPADGTPVTDVPVPRLPNDQPNVGGALGTRSPGAHMRTGTISGFTDSSITFREGANSSTLSITPDTVVQMDGRNISLRQIPANAQVRVERDPANANRVQRIVVVPNAAATGAVNANANPAGNTVRTQTGTGSTGSANRSLPSTGPNDTGSFQGGTSVNTQTGTGSTGSANRSFAGNDINAPTANGSTPGNDINAPTPNGSTPNNDINAPTANASTPNNDINAPTANASTPGNDINSPVVNQPNISNRPLAPGQTNPADQPRAPFTRGPEQRLQAGFNEPGTQNQNNRNQPAATDGSQFLGPVTGGVPSKPNTVNQAPSVDTGANAPVTLPDNGVTPIGQNPANVNPPQGRGDRLWTDQIGTRLGMQMSETQQGLTIGNVTGQSAAATSGLQAGDRIQSINGTNISTAADFGRALQAANRTQGPITASVLRNGTPQNVDLSLPSGFFNGLNIPAATAAGANALGTAPAAVTGAGNVAVTPDGTVGVNAGGVLVPAEGQTQVGAAGAAAGATPTTGAQSVEQQTIVQQSTPARVRTGDPPVGTQRQGVTTEALKVPDVNLGWTLKSTPEGVVMSTLVEDGLAAKNLFQTGDIIESIDGRPVTSPGAVSYELHRHRAGATVEFGLLRNGQRITEEVTLPENHQPLLLNRNETFGQANNSAQQQGGSGSNPLPVRPTEESRRTLEEENRALRQEIEELRRKK